MKHLSLIVAGLLAAGSATIATAKTSSDIDNMVRIEAHETGKQIAALSGTRDLVNHRDEDGDDDRRGGHDDDDDGRDHD